MRRTIGGNAQDRRRARRAASRRQTNGLSDQDVRDIQSMIAAASGSTDLPLSDQDAAWDSGAAVKTLDPADFPKAYFWKDPDGDATTKAAFKLPFASKASGKLMAIWRGVTAAAGAVQGARGGVSIPSGDVGAVKARIAGYYADAAKKFNDPSIKPPWEGNESAGETAAFLLAYAECAGTLSRTEIEGADIQYASHTGFEDDGETPREGMASVYTTDETAMEEFEARLLFWADAFAEALPYAAITHYIDAVLSDPHMLGGKPSKGTKKDKRLKGNMPGGDEGHNDNDQDGTPEDDNMSVQPYDEAVGVGLAALEAVEELAASVKCGCGHAYSEHSGAGGTCGHEDGRGTCRCGEFAYPDADVQALAAAIVAARPDLAGFEVEVARIAERTLLALEAAAGDVAWGPEDGFIDLLCDVNRTLMGQNGSSYDYDGPMESGYGPRAVDAGVKLDKVLICDGGAYFVAPITIDGQGEPVLSDRADWVPVEGGAYVEVAEPEENAAKPMAMQMRFALRDFAITAATTAELAPEAVEVIPEKSDEITPPTANANGEIPWTATFVPEGVVTEDGRAFAPGAIILPPDEQARQLPLTLMGLIETSAEGGHDRAKVAGRIDSMWREDDTGKVKASGVFSNEEWGAMIARMVESKELTGLSVDIAPLEYEHVNRADWFNEKGEWTAVQGEDGEWAPANGATMQEPESLEEWLNADLVLAITKAVIGMATVCPFPAFGAAEISLAASGMPRTYTGPLDLQFDCGCTPVEVAYGSEEQKDEGEALTAAAAGLAPVSPPAEWFSDPEFTEPTPMTVTDEGHIFGHAWQWNTCHLSFDQCVTAPKSETNYAYYMLGEIACDDGERLAVGKITMDTGHAGTRLSRVDATAHYDNTGTVAAHVQFGEDEFGGWFSGAISPELSEEKVRLLRGATVSGDWRGVDGNLELVGLLACNVPGFPVPRSLQASVVVVNDEPVIQALVAAGIVTLGLEADIVAMVNEVVGSVEA
jgi:hypothetical protein